MKNSSPLNHMDTDSIKQTLSTAAAEIRRLRARIHDTFQHRHASQPQKIEWENACAEFHARYDMLAFPGGYDGRQRGKRLPDSNSAIARIAAGNAEAMEAAICFLELRPYFFRSGYMFKQILRKMKRAPLSSQQADRLQIVIARQAMWRWIKTTMRPRLKSLANTLRQRFPAVKFVMLNHSIGALTTYHGWMFGIEACFPGRNDDEADNVALIIELCHLDRNPRVMMDVCWGDGTIEEELRNYQGTQEDWPELNAAAFDEIVRGFPKMMRAFEAAVTRGHPVAHI